MMRYKLRSIVTDRANQLLQIDFENLSAAEYEGKTYIGLIVMVDHFTKFSVSVKLTNFSSDSAMTAIKENYIDLYGSPEVIQSDQGPQFESELFKLFCKMHGICKVRSTAYHPQSNGLVERQNQTLVKMFKTVLLQQSDWPRYVTTVNSAYNATVHESTKFTPNMLFLGKEASHAMWWFFKGYHPTDALLISKEDYVAESIKRTGEIFECVRNNQKQAQIRQKRNFDARARDHHKYELGEFVSVFVNCVPSGNVRKMTPRWRGPFKILKIFEGGIYYEVEQKNEHVNLPNRLKKFKVHYNRMTKYYPRPHHFAPNDDDDIIELWQNTGDQEEYSTINPTESEEEIPVETQHDPVNADEDLIFGTSYNPRTNQGEYQLDEFFGHSFPRTCPNQDVREELGSMVTEDSRVDRITRDCFVDIMDCPVKLFNQPGPSNRGRTFIEPPPMYSDVSEKTYEDEEIISTRSPDQAVRIIPNDSITGQPGANASSDISTNEDHSHETMQSIHSAHSMRSIHSADNGSNQGLPPMEHFGEHNKNTIESLINDLESYDPRDLIMGDGDDICDDICDDMDEMSESGESQANYPDVQSPRHRWIDGQENIYQRVSPPRILQERSPLRTERNPLLWNQDIPVTRKVQSHSGKQPRNSTQNAPTTKGIEREPYSLRSGVKSRRDPNFLYCIEDIEFCNAKQENIDYRISYSDRKANAATEMTKSYDKPIDLKNPITYWKVNPLNFADPLNHWDKILQSPVRILPGESKDEVMLVQSIDSLRDHLDAPSESSTESDACSTATMESQVERMLEAEEVCQIELETWDIPCCALPKHSTVELQKVLDDILREGQKLTGQEEIEEAKMQIDADRTGEWCRASIATMNYQKYIPRVYPPSIMVDLKIGNIWESPGPLVMEVAADLVLDRGVLKVLRKEFSEEALQKAFNQCKGPGEIIKFTTKSQCPGYIVMLITRSRKEEPTSEKWLRQSLEKLELFLIEHPRITEIHCTEFSVNNRRLRGNMLIRMMEEVVHLTGVSMRVWIAPTEPMAAIASQHQINVIGEIVKYQGSAKNRSLGGNHLRWFSQKPWFTQENLSQVIINLTNYQRRVQAKMLKCLVVISFIIILLMIKLYV
jgi:hypothetical protein